MDEGPAGPARRPPWGWRRPTRGLLSGAVALASGALALLGSETQGPGAAPPPDRPPVIDPNAAPTGVLLALPRLGPTLVRRIEAERGLAPFASLGDLEARVKGIGPATRRALEPYMDVRAEDPGPPPSAFPGPTTGRASSH